MDCSFAGAACAFLCCNIGVSGVVAGSLRLDTKVQMALKQQESQGIFQAYPAGCSACKAEPCKSCIYVLPTDCT